MSHEIIMELVEKWRNRAREMADRNKSTGLSHTHASEMEIANAIQDCAADLLLAYSAVLNKKS